MENGNKVHKYVCTVPPFLTPAMKRLLQYLRQEPGAQTFIVREACQLGNVSDVARRANQRLEAANDPRRIKCVVYDAPNRFGHVRPVGFWYIQNLPGGQAANDPVYLTLL